jgi:nucleoid-associated protein YgaU
MSSTPPNRTYTVEEGDTLRKIAQRQYGEADKWHAIYEANRSQIQDPDHLKAGQALIIPDAT